MEMDGYRSGSALSQGTYTYGSSFTVSYVELAELKISSLKNVWDSTVHFTFYTCSSYLTYDFLMDLKVSCVSTIFGSVY